jgi:hypothetical protein
MLALVVLLSLVVARPLSVRADGPNLVQNPGFERPYVALPKKENCAVAAPWVAWFREGTLAEVSQGYRFAPEYKAAFRADYPGNRVRNGELAQQWFHSYGNFEAGVLQQVSNIAVGSKLRFEIWGMSWSCDKESSGRCGGAVSYNGSPMHFKIGIDPTGGGEPFSPAIIWSEENNAYDNWTLFQVEAVAQKSTVTVYVYSYPTYRSQDNNIYLDDASLVVVAAPPAPTRKPTVAPTSTNQPARANQCAQAEPDPSAGGDSNPRHGLSGAAAHVRSGAVRAAGWPAGDCDRFCRGPGPGPAQVAPANHGSSDPSSLTAEPLLGESEEQFFVCRTGWVPIPAAELAFASPGPAPMATVRGPCLGALRPPAPLAAWLAALADGLGRGRQERS